MSGKNLKLSWGNTQERHLIEKLKNKAPRYKIDEEGDSVLSHYELPQSCIADILGIPNIEVEKKAAKLLDQYKLESTPMDELPREEVDFSTFPRQPKDFQARVITVNRAKASMILNLATGAGKSLTALYRCRVLAGHNNFKLLVIAPKALVVKSNKWREEVTKCLERPSFRFWAIGKDKRDKLLKEVPQHDIILTTYDQVGYLEGFQPDFIIVDEGHLIRGERTMRHKGVLKALRRSPEAPLLITTGTPKPNTLENLWVLIKLVASTLAGKKQDFLKKYQKVLRYIEIPYTLPSGAQTILRKPVVKEINLDQLYKHVASVMYTVPKDEVIEFEDCLDFINLEMLPKQKKAYYALAHDVLRKKEEGVLEYAEALTAVLRLQQIAEGLFNLPDYGSDESNKFDYISSVIEELEGEKLIVWSRFRPITLKLFEKYKDRAVLFNGTVSEAQSKLGMMSFNGVESEEELQEFIQLSRRQKNWKHQPGEAQFLFGVMHEVSSIGLDFQRYCNRQIVSAQSDLMDTDIQALSRIVRLGQQAEFTQTDYLFSSGSLDRKKYENKLIKHKNTVHATQSKYSTTFNKLELLLDEIRGDLS